VFKRPNVTNTKTMKALFFPPRSVARDATLHPRQTDIINDARSWRT